MLSIFFPTCLNVLFQGKVLLDHMKQLEPRGVNLKIAVNGPQTYRANTDELSGTGRFDSFIIFKIFTVAKHLIQCILRSGAEVREVDLTNITGGIIHTKLWVVDKKHMYVGSANMDWRSLTQVFWKISASGIRNINSWQFALLMMRTSTQPNTKYTVIYYTIFNIQLLYDNLKYTTVILYNSYVTDWSIIIFNLKHF